GQDGHNGHNGQRAADTPDALALLAATAYAGLMAGAMERVLAMTLDYANTRAQFGKSIGRFQAVQQQISVMAEEVWAANMAAQLAFQSQVTQPGDMPRVMAGALPNAMPGATPGSIPSAMPAATPGATPGAMPGARPSAMPGAMPGAMPSAMPSATPGAMPGVMPSVMPGAMQAAVGKARTSQAAPRVADIAHAVHGAIGVTAEFDLQLYTRRLRDWRLAAGSESFWHAHIGAHALQGEDSALDLIRRVSQGQA
ncbi:acyl-CoA dehydrogenase family protein, partial [Achromobacter sp. LC458]|uniref:acyl-CoA dehydrogenase family protein n=1 Tax=Achromobacter sp. LC458 TaxID=1120623 RepID=UPI0021049A51